MKRMKRCIAFFMALVVSFSTVGEVYASEQAATVTEFVEAATEQVEEATEETETEQAEEATEEEFKTGLLEVKEVEISQESVEEPYACDEDLLNIMIYSKEYHGSWDKYSTNYYYNQMSEEERRVWDAWEVMCMEYLCTAKDAIAQGELYRTELVASSSLSKAELSDLALIFRYANPQYYFLNNYIFSSSSQNSVRVGFGIYAAFADGVDREAATSQVKSQVEAWEVLVAACATDAEKVQMIHDLICEKVEYNNAIYGQDFDEEQHFSQSAYSVFCMDTTVCAGYTQAFEMMCNGVGIDAISVTSLDHGWNKVRVNDSWYNVDCTWADQDVIYYKWFERSDAYYDTASNAASHAEEEFWLEYLPLCTLDANPIYNTVPGTLPEITSITAEPKIVVNLVEEGYTVEISCVTPGAEIYYTLNGEEPTPAYTRAYKYTGAFEISELCEIKAVAVCDAYLDSNVASASTYAITYVLNGGTNHPDNPSSVTGGRTVELQNPTKTGYTFAGWYTDEEFKNAITAIPADIKEDITVYAKWTANTFTITFKANDTSATGTMPVQSIVYGSGTKLSLNAFKSDSAAFTGWNTKADGSGSSYEDGADASYMTTENGANIVLYAQWTVNKYTISYHKNGATSGTMKDTSCVYGKKYTLTANSYKRTGYKFTGWNTKKDGSGTGYKNKAEVESLASKNNEKVILYAQWQKVKYTITYKLNGGTNHKKNPSSYDVTTAAVKLQKPTKTGYTFDGWYSDAKFKTKVTQIAKGSTGNKKLYAKWTANKYTITYHKNGATSGSMKKTACVYGKKYKLTANSYERTGYKFVGWNTKKNGSGTTYKNKAQIKSLVSKNNGKITLYAQWKKK